MTYADLQTLCDILKAQSIQMQGFSIHVGHITKSNDNRKKAA